MRVAQLLGALGLALGASLAAPALPTSLSASVPLVGAAPAAAAGCASASGVTVVVDYNQLSGDRVEQACVANGGGRVAFDVFEDAGARQTVTREFPGFICRVNGLPGTDTENCRTASPADAYWSLWWTDGKGGDWIYSNLGARSLKVPDGAYLAWSWQGQSAKAPPSVTPSARQAAPGSDGGSTGDSDSGNGVGGSGGGRGGSGGSSSGDGGSTGSGGSGSSDPGSSSGSDDSGAADGARGGDAGRDGSGRGGDGDGARAGKGGKAGDGPGGRKARGGRDADEGDRAGDGEDGISESSTLSGEDGESIDGELTSGDSEDPAGLPAWVPLVVLVVLAAGGVGAVLWRRRTAGGA